MATEKRLISVDDCPCDGCKAKPCGHPARCVKFALWLNKTVDAVEPAHGEWEFGEFGPLGAEVKCTNCGWGRENVDPILWLNYPGHRFCGACGAKMDGERKDNE